MVDSRLRIPLPRLYECFVEVSAPDPEAGIGPLLKRYHPENFQEKEELLAQIPTFCFPCKTDSPGVQYFTFVLTDIDGKFRFGFCRYPAHAPSCICIVSYAPWFEMFYMILNNISDAELRGENDLVIPLLNELRDCAVPDVGASVRVTAKYLSTSKVFKYDVPDTTKLPTIPENRNLTEYFAAITPEIMIQLFISMLFERRILVTSKKLSLVTAIVHGSVSLLYPMQWQHIFVPVLPPKLLDYCCAPMPFLLGVHSSMMSTVRQMPLDEVVILDADKNEITSPFDDMEVFPQEVTSKLLSKLKRTERALDDYVASQFIRALVKVIGGYRDSLRFKEMENGEGGRIVFDEEAFLISRHSAIRPFLEHILHLQSFMQFVDGRLDLLNAGIEVGDIFEQEVLNDSGDNSKWRSQYQQWRGKMKKGGGALKKTVAIQYAFLKGKANDMELKSKVKAIYKGAKSGVKSGYKGAKHQFKEAKHQIKHLKVKESQELNNQVKRAGTFPSSQLVNVKESPFRHSMYSTLPSSRIQHGVKRIPKHGAPPRPPGTTNLERYALTKSASSDCIKSSVDQSEDYTIDEEPSSPTLLEMADTHSEPSMSNLIDLDSISLQEADNQSITENMVDLFAQDNPSFFDDQFIIVDDETSTELEHKNLVNQSRNSNGSWVTFDDNITNETSSKQQSTPVVEIGYEDLFKAHSEQDKFVVVSSDNHVTETSLVDLLKHSNIASTTEEDIINPQSSLLTDTLSSVSAETRSLFAKSSTPNEITDEMRSPGSDKKRRRPPPKPPVSRQGHTHSHPPPPVSLPRRPPSNPGLTISSRTSLQKAETNCLQPIKANVNNAEPQDPFADLLMETRSSLSLNQGNK